MKKLMVTIAALAMFAGSAYAADWNFYGSARVDTFYTSSETNAVTTNNTLWALQPYSRIGADVKVSDELDGRFEYGTDGGANIRLLYGEWNFGAGKLLVGQAYNPLHVFQSSQTYLDYGMGGVGEVYAGRVGQLRLTFGDFQVALVAPSVKYTNTLGDLGADTEVKIPGVVAKYKIAADNWGLVFMGGYSSFEAGASTATADTVTSYMLGAGADITLGSLWLAANVSGGQNQGNLTAIETSAIVTGSGYAYYDGTHVRDNDAIAYSLVARYTINDMFSLEAGYGYQETQLDIAAAPKDKVQTYYLQVPITLASGVFLMPEVGVLDYKEAGQSELTYYGATWKINF